MKHLHTYGFVLAALLASGCASTSSTTSKAPVTDAEKLRGLATTYGQTITAADLSKHLNIIASDAYEGRNTGEKGQKMAAEYISKEFREDGLTGPVTANSNPYYQPVSLEKGTWGDGHIMVGTRKFAMMQDFFPMGSSVYTTEQSAMPVFIADNAAIDTASLKGKMLVAMVTNLAEAEKKMNDIGQLARKAEAASVMYVLGADAFTMMNQRYAGRLRQASISLPGKTNSRRTTTFIASPALGAAILGTTPDKLTATTTNYKPVASIQVLTKRNTTPLPSENVLGFIEGSDKKDEVVVVTAHYDHVGIEQDAEGEDKIFNGANDDGSGTVAVIELAEAFAQAKKAGHGPRRSILFMTVTAEEKGLLGSEYYSENPIFPLANTVANVNIDMIGRMDFDYEKTNDSNYIYVIGADKLSSELHAINEEANQKYTNLKLDYKYNDENDPNRFYYRSDHYNFAKNGIPIIFYFNGVHADYHKPSDSVDKILFDSAEKVARLAFYTTWELANRDNRIVVDSNKK
ncbi:M28 family peptidase [Pontibacter sp. KCTC 32443]|uniref:M28 family peptidase n=1 Tax=Pontibacter TaxID=323449 RepID=UPI00164EA1A4|nr:MULTISPECIES: M28 family peptidase [Pontibacter]MBC5775854.1 M28 family peptidase [Pontibacter sp. KCTC 32443]